MSDPEIASQPAGRGWDWIKDGFALFKLAPGQWILLILLWGVINIVANLIPLGGLVMSVVSPILTGGIMLACRRLEAEQTLSPMDLFTAFKTDAAGSLALLGVASLIMLLLLGLVVGGLMFVSLGGVNLQGGQPGAGSVFFLTLVTLGLLLPILMALWFAPALIALGGLPVIAALKTSLRGCLANIGSLTIYGLVMILLAIPAMIPMMLGLLVLVPVGLAATYRAYCEIFAGAVRADEADAPALIE